MSSRISGTSRGLLCHCGLQTSLLTSRKKHSYGRKFYSCPRSITEQCKFFRWADGLTETPEDKDRECRTSFEENIARELHCLKVKNNIIILLVVVVVVLEFFFALLNVTVAEK